MAEVLTEREPESVRVLQWRMDGLIRGGFSVDNAELIADSKVDIAFAVRALANAEAQGRDDDFVTGLIL